jgi:SmpA / OmlA family
MKRPMMVVLSALVVGLGGCDKLPKIPFLSKKAAAARDTTTNVAMASKADTTQHAATMAAPPTQAAPPRRTAPAVPLTDEPWTPTDTGTVDPGMTRDQVIAVWGVPVAERTQGNHTYLYFRNGCEVTCGTFDVVFLDSDKVVDAIVRGQGHTYSGVSSSPTARTPQDARPGAGPGL